MIESLIKALVSDGVRDRDTWHDWKVNREDEIATALGYSYRPSAPRAVHLVAPHFHPTLPLIGLNYTPAAGLGLPAAEWPEQLKRCRGIVFDDMAIVVAKPFPKFFNWGELGHTAALPAEITEKLDGHLVIAFQYRDHIVFTTRGDFESPTAELIGELMRDNELPLDKYTTLLCEFLHPETHVGVDYGDRRGLFVIGATINGQDANYSHVAHLANRAGLPVVDKVNVAWRDLLNVPFESRRDREGYVARWLDGTRFKFKYKGYIDARREEREERRQERAPRVIGHRSRKESAIFPSTPWLRRPI